MTRKKIITWIGVISGLITILLVFDNPFQDKADLVAYVENQETLYPVQNSEGEIDYNSQYSLKMTLKNVGELPAKDVHISVKDARGFAVIKYDSVYKKIENSTSVYIGRLEAGTEAEIFYWGSFYSVTYFGIDENFSISSSDSGKAELRTDIKGDNVIWYIEKYFVLIVTSLFILGAIYLQVWAQRQVPVATKSEYPDDFEKQLDKLNHAWSIGIITEKEFQSKGKLILDKYLNQDGQA
ncbi:membrane protein [Aliivibrio wodanis]|uniref:Membrane protein n=1 Tax=Aliivibrio wodanis TaxID=80852 RepID=A0A090K0V0_9GAMM|nr:membrane protein [Aliivibrio wodanis]